MVRDDFYASPFGVVFSAYMERPRLSRAIGRLLWGGDSRDYYLSMAAAGEVGPGGTIVDCPCGAGPALRGLRPEQQVRYVAADLSPAMLRRARKRAAARGLDRVEFVEADATDLPLADGAADLFSSYWGLHCFERPELALAEAARLLRPGGRLVGSSFFSGDLNRRQRLMIRPGLGDFGRVGGREEVEGWIAKAGFELRRVTSSGPMLFFDATRLADGPA